MEAVGTPLLMKMARQAVKDPSLLASQFEWAAEREGWDWNDIARRLHIDSARLAKLALCRRPNTRTFNEDVRQIAEASGVNPVVLTNFLKKIEFNDAPRPAAQKISRPVSQHSWPGRALALGLGLMLVVLAVLGVFVFSASAGSQATLVVVEGQAVVTPAKTVASLFVQQDDLTIAAGEMLAVQAGDFISLAPSGTAELRMYDGSTLDLFDGASLSIEELNTDSNTYRAGFKQFSGKTVNRVLRLLGVGDRYEIQTPSSTVSVRGTVYSVEVLAPDTTLVSVEKGVVEVVTGDQSVMVHAGEQVLSKLGTPSNVEPQASPVPPLLIPTPASVAPPSNPAAAPTQAAPTVGSTPAAGSPPDPNDPATSSQPSDGTGTTTGDPSDPKQVPGNPPVDPPGSGDPPDGGGDPPGNDPQNNKDKEKHPGTGLGSTK